MLHWAWSCHKKFSTLEFESSEVDKTIDRWTEMDQIAQSNPISLLKLSLSPVEKESHAHMDDYVSSWLQIFKSYDLASSCFVRGLNPPCGFPRTRYESSLLMDKPPVADIRALVIARTRHWKLRWKLSGFLFEFWIVLQDLSKIKLCHQLRIIFSIVLGGVGCNIMYSCEKIHTFNACFPVLVSSSGKGGRMDGNEVKVRAQCCWLNGREQISLLDFLYSHLHQPHSLPDRQSDTTE